MFEANHQAITQKTKEAIELIHKEIEAFGSFELQYKELKDFREDLRKFYRWSFLDKIFHHKVTKIPNGDILDHHCIGYFAPFNFKRKSWGGGWRNPCEHIAYLSEALKKHNTRLIYVALPCKKVIYPQLVSSSFKESATTAPQWRKMVLELLQNGVEVIDMFPVFMQNKEMNRLFAFGHHISYEGASLTAKTIADYIKQTSFLKMQTNPKFELTQKIKNVKSGKINRLYRVNLISKESKSYAPYNENSSNICIFGNCNLQAFHEEGSGIAANLAYELNKEIDYIGRKLIFAAGVEKFDKEAFEECCKRDIAICISFPSGSFVRTSLNSKSKKEFLKSFLKFRNLRTRNWYDSWSDTNLYKTK